MAVVEEEWLTMPSFLRNTSGRRIRIEVPMALPQDCEYGIYSTSEAYETKQVIIRDGDKVVLTIDADGTITHG